MDIITLALAKKFATKVAAGFSNVEVDGLDIIFTLNDGSQVTLTVPEPADGISVVDMNIDDDGSLICTMSNGTTIDAGGVPFVKPEKGVDYWTEEDKAEIKTYVDDVTSNAFAAELDEENFTLLLKRVGSSYHDQMADISTSLDEISGEVI
jgi:hypothetical protein